MTAIDHDQIQANIRRRARFREALLQAEARRLGRILRSSGPLRRNALVRREWSGHSDVEVVRGLRAGLAAGEIRDLGGGLYAARDADAAT